MGMAPAIQQHVESWLATQDYDIRKYRSLAALKDLYLSRQPPRAVGMADREALYDDVKATIGDVPLTYLEFGVFQGKSIASMAEGFTHPGAKFFGFDSFEGLPEDWVLNWKTMPRGTFSLAGRPPALSDERIHFVKGWFQNTVPAFLDDNKNLLSGTVLAHFDADLYSSTLFLLSSMWSKIDSYYFIFDEFMEHEVIALHDFASAFPVSIEFFCQADSGGFPNKIFGRMSRIPFTIG